MNCVTKKKKLINDSNHLVEITSVISVALWFSDKKKLLWSKGIHHKTVIYFIFLMYKIIINDYHIQNQL